MQIRYWVIMMFVPLFGVSACNNDPTIQGAEEDNSQAKEQKDDTSTEDNESNNPVVKKCQSNADCLLPQLPKCNKESGLCEAVICSVDSDCVNPALPKCNQESGKCEAAAADQFACKLNDDCKTEYPHGENWRCIAETGKCELPTYGKKSCNTNADCTDSYFSACDEERHSCTHPCSTMADCRICNNLCVDTDDANCNTKTGLCEPFPLCTLDSFEECITACSESKDQYFLWRNGVLVNKKCQNNSCHVLQATVSGQVECQEPDKPMESCIYGQSEPFCSVDDSRVWYCSMDNTYFDNPCDEQKEVCHQCGNMAGCIPKVNCSKDSIEKCNQVCNNERDGYYMWDGNQYDPETGRVGGIVFYVCPLHDCVNKCGIAECQSGEGYHAGDNCNKNQAAKYCTLNGRYKFECIDNVIVQKSCKNNDCLFDAINNIIRSCTEE